MFKFEVIPASQAPAALNSNSSRNDDWDRLAESLRDVKLGDWIRVTFDQLPGKSTASKCSNLVKVLAARKLNVVSRPASLNPSTSSAHPGGWHAWTTWQPSTRTTQWASHLLMAIACSPFRSPS